MATGNFDMLAVVSHIERERGVEREIVLVAIEQAIEQAARRNPAVTNDLRVTIDRKDLSLHVYDTLVVSSEETGTGFISPARAKRFKPDVGEGDTIEIELPAARLGRIAAQTSRQVIMQKIREAERSNTFTEFKNRIGDIVNGTVTAISHRDVFVMVGKTEMILPGKERLPNEDFQVGDSVNAVIHNVRQSAEASGPSVVLSRTSNEFLRAMMRRDVSEIADGVVEIMGIARDPGYRAKVAVRSHDPKVEPVGACVGLRGIRVRGFVRELNGEKIDMVRWNEDVRQYVAAALSPAKLDRVEIDPENSNTILVTVSPDQYTLAIGKRGQNVRLTSKLVGWQVTVNKSLAMASFEDQKAAAIKSLADLFSISTAQATQLADAGFLSVDGILAVEEGDFAAATGFDEVTAKGLYAAAMAVAELTK
ncbi:MAG: transcription termination factor NusA [Kiritimatiellae bacterium]|nr:transcription termination factor NusA [Kiritimatiellia bacterium]